MEKEQLTSIEERRRILREKYAKYQAIVREEDKIREQRLEDIKKFNAKRKEAEKIAAEKHKMHKKLKDEKLKRLRDRTSNYEEWIHGIFFGDLDVQEEVIASLMEQLGIQPEKWRNAFDTEKNKFIASDATVQDMGLKAIEEETAPDANKYEETLKKLHGFISRHDEWIEKVLSGDEDEDVLRYQMKPWKIEDWLKFSWVTAAIAVATTVAAAGMLTIHTMLGRIAKD